jgi:hypothetical protein
LPPAAIQSAHLDRLPVKGSSGRENDTYGQRPHHAEHAEQEGSQRNLGKPKTLAEGAQLHQARNFDRLRSARLEPASPAAMAKARSDNELSSTIVAGLTAILAGR